MGGGGCDDKIRNLKNIETIMSKKRNYAHNRVNAQMHQIPVNGSKCKKNYFAKSHNLLYTINGLTHSVNNTEKEGCYI